MATMVKMHHHKLKLSAYKSSTSIDFRPIYRNEYAVSKDIGDFLDRLRLRFPEMQIKQVSSDTIVIAYTYCACDIVKDGHITDPRYCKCSQMSLLHNWRTVLWVDSVEVDMHKTILAGDDKCIFTVKLLSIQN